MTIPTIKNKHLSQIFPEFPIQKFKQNNNILL